MSLHINNKQQKGKRPLLTTLLVATSLVGIAPLANAQPAQIPEVAGPPAVVAPEVDTSWLDARYLNPDGAVTPIATKASGKWIEYNLSNYCVYLHDGGKIVHTDCTTSSGKKGHATPTGTFTVKKKAAGPICMHPPGDKEVCGIHYATYFTSKGAAFHEAYWNRTWNQRVSHGCVNMTLSGAKTVYNFATIGMTVKVHW